MGDSDQAVFTKRQLVQITCAVTFGILLANLIMMGCAGLFILVGPEIFALGNMTGVTVVDAGGFVGEIEVPVNLQLKMVVRAGDPELPADVY